MWENTYRLIHSIHNVLCMYVMKKTKAIKHNNCMNDPVRHKKLIKNQIKSSKLKYDNTFTNKKPRKNWKFSNFDALEWSYWKVLIICQIFNKFFVSYRIVHTVVVLYVPEKMNIFWHLKVRQKWQNICLCIASFGNNNDYNCRSNPGWLIPE